MSPDVGVLDTEALGEMLAEQPDEAVAMLVDMARATDPALRAAARAAAATLLVPPTRHGRPGRRGGAGRVRRGLRDGTELDLDGTVAALVGAPGDPGDALRYEDLARPASAYVLVVDASGSVSGAPLARAVTTAAALATRLRPDEELAVVAFWSVAVVLRQVRATSAPVSVLDSLFDLRGGDVTDLAAGLRAALAQAGLARAGRREVLVLTDGLATEGGDPLAVAASSAAAGARLHVLALSDADDATDATMALASAGGGHRAELLRASDAAAAVAAVLTD